MIDLHGHYLPWVDDGAGSLEEAVRMLRMAEADGVRCAVLTPTIDCARGPVARDQLERKFAAFAQLVQRRGIHMRLRLGAELLHRPDAIEAVDRGEIPFIGEWEGRRVLLLRWAEDFIPIGAIGTTQQLVARDILPMLAHPERNPGVIRSPGSLDLFLCDGCLVQVDAGSVLGWHGPAVRETAFRLIEAGRVTVLASGAADASTRPPMLRAARDIVAQRFGDEVANRLAELNPSLVLAEDPFRDSGAHVAVASIEAPAVAFDLPLTVAELVAASDDAPVLSEAFHARVAPTPPQFPEPAPAQPFGVLGIRGEPRAGVAGRDGRPVPPAAEGLERGRRRRRSRVDRSDREPVIAPPDPGLPLMRF